MVYLAFDTETTGLDPTKHNVLTAYFVLLDESLNKIDSLALSIRRGEYVVSAKALEINKIDLVEHNKISASLFESRKKFEDFISPYNDLICIGHNVQFDIDFILSNKILSRELYKKHFNIEKKVDTLLILRKIKNDRKLPSEQSLSLSKITDFLNIKLVGNENFHTAEYDILITIELLKYIKERFDVEYI